MDFISQLDGELVAAQKAKNGNLVDTLRGLKSRLQNEQIAKGRNLEDQEIVAIVRSEIKRRKEAAEAYKTGGRAELEQKELKELEILSKYAPAGPAKADIDAFIDKIISDQNLSAQDFGKAMGQLKGAFPGADGAELAASLKEKLH